MEEIQFFLFTDDKIAMTKIQKNGQKQLLDLMSN